MGESQSLPTILVTAYLAVQQQIDRVKSVGWKDSLDQYKFKHPLRFCHTPRMQHYYRVQNTVVNFPHALLLIFKYVY